MLRVLSEHQLNTCGTFVGNNSTNQFAYEQNDGNMKFPETLVEPGS